MRQTSRAVALLLVLESARAANAPVTVAATNAGGAITIFNPTVIDSNIEQATNRSASYKMILPSVGGQMSWSAITISRSKQSATEAQDVIFKEASSECMHCLNKAGVWCSSTYAFQNTTNTVTMAAVTDKNMYTTALTSSTSTVGQYDNGSCCGTTTLFKGWVGSQATAAVMPVYATGNTTDALSSQLTAGQPLTSNSCIAISKTGTGSKYDGSGGTTGTSAWDLSTVTYTSWWCSNGLYKKVTVNGSDGVSNTNTIIPLGNNQRKELAQVACPQISAWCGTQVMTAMTNTTAQTLIEIPKTVAFVETAKCTWVASSLLYAPTFTISKGVAAASIGLATQNWTIHHMEYTAASAAFGYSSTNQNNLSSGSAAFTGIQAVADGVNKLNNVPLFTMPAEQFATLRTWYGAGYTTPGTMAASGASTVLAGQTLNWFAPYQNSAAVAAPLSTIAGQYYGNVANFPSSSYSAATPTATSSYGVSGSTAKYDVRVVRYFPAQVAQMSWMTGSTASTLYASKLTSYNTAKATWDAYVAILAKNAKTDAFAAAFSPPKAPTVPPLPNMPWTPAAYSGYLKQTPAQASIQAANTGSAYVLAAQPTNQQFWTSLDAAQSIGGWGSFTAQIITYREGWGKSFGTIGYSGDAAKETMSQVWNYKWMCGTASGVSPTANQACDATYSTTTDATAATSPYTTTAANTTFTFFVAISLWSNGNTGTGTTWKWIQGGTGQQSFAIQWKASAWANTLPGLIAIAAPTPAIAASSLTGLAGAQALAASTAAALAAAAALY